LRIPELSERAYDPVSMEVSNGEVAPPKVEVRASSERRTWRR
jgi:hypothetical protein